VPNAYVLVSSLTPHDATTTLFFDHLSGRAPLQIASVSGGSLPRLGSEKATGSLARALAGASALIVVRGLFEFDRLAICSRWLNIPRYYFVDDNFIVLRDDAGVADARWFKDYSIERVRDALKSFAGVLLATPSLVKYFRDHRLHERTILFPPVAPSALPAAASRSGGTVTVGFFGGLHRREPYLRFVYPALQRLAREQPLRLVVAGIDRRDLPSDARLPTEFLDYNPSYTDGLRAMAAYGIDVLAHPGSFHVHNAFKNTHVLINAQTLGAVPVFSVGPPYDEIANDGVALLSENTADAWYAALGRVAADVTLRESMRTRLAAYCATHFSGRENLEMIATILREHPAPTAGLRSMRLLLGIPFQGLSLGQHVMSRAFARLGQRPVMSEAAARQQAGRGRVE
jgi:glycosyltransferase involved in cell wall biosynthesis